MLRADLHLHSCLSPCGGLDASPARMAAAAAAAGVQVVALADHNSALNCPAFEKVCRDSGLQPVFGMEVCTAEEIHVLCYFGALRLVMELNDFIAAHLPRVPLRPEKMGDQVYVNERDEIEGAVDVFLGVAAALTLSELADYVRARRGVVVAAHVDRPSHSVLTRLGRIPDGIFQALELSRHAGNPPPAVAPGRWALLTGSDAHYPADIGSTWTELDLPDWSFAGFVEALRSPERVRRRMAPDRRPR